MMSNKITKYMLRTTLAAVMVGGITACTTWQDETIDSAYILPTIPDPEYKFSRNNESSIDILECELLKEPIDIIYNSFLKEARISGNVQQERMLEYFNQGLYGKAPKDEIAASVAHKGDKEKIEQCFEDIFVQSRTLGGFDNPHNYNETRNKKAEKGTGGYLGYNIGDANIAFVNEKGIAVAEVYNEMIRGSVYLDKILNVHLNPELYNDAKLIAEQEITDLVPGHNYTQLEHHWDLAYGYYQYWLPVVQKNEHSALRGTRIKLYNAFARGRLALTLYRFDEARECLNIIRQELSRVAAVHAMQLLAGETTKVNLHEDVSNALIFLSRAYGAIFSLQFALDSKGEPLYSFDEVMALLNAMKEGDGLWEKERLEADESTRGSIAFVIKDIKGHLQK